MSEPFASALKRLADRLDGRLLVAGDPGYDSARAVWNAMIDRRPRAIVGCVGTDDVAAAVRFAREHALEIGVRCRGHFRARAGGPESGLMIDLTPMGDVRVDPGRRIARVLGGVAVPDQMSVSTAAQLLTNPLTALVLVTRELELEPGEWLVQTAPGSTVGRLVIQLGRHFGYRTINVVRRREAVDEILKLGGTGVICTEDEDLGERVAEIAGEEGVGKAIDCVAGLLGGEVARSLAPGGEMMIYGALSTHRQTEPDQLALDPRSMIYGTKTVRSFWLYRWVSTTPQQEIGAALAQTFELVAGETIRIPEAQPVGLTQFADAMRLAEAPAHGGKPLLVLGED